MRWYTSDTHFWHRNIIDLCNRPFTDLPEMHEAIINNWNSCVKPQDEVFIIGDMFFCGAVKIKAIMTRLNGKKHLIRGNHDWRNIKPHRLDLGFDSIVEGMTLEIDNKPVVLSHFPYLGDHTEADRYMNFRPKDGGHWLIHGHVHNGWKIRDRMINVGVDQWNFTPISEDNIIEIMKGHV